VRATTSRIAASPRPAPAPCSPKGDYRALSWAVGKLQTDADRERVIDGLSLSDAGVGSARDSNRVVKKLKRRGRSAAIASLQFLLDKY
jgi:hypothetical protein